MNRETVKIVGRIIGVLVAVLLLTNPPRSKFNNAVFEGGTPNSITSDQQKMNQIIEVNGKLITMRMLRASNEEIIFCIQSMR